MASFTTDHLQRHLLFVPVRPQADSPVALPTRKMIKKHVAAHRRTKARKQPSPEERHDQIPRRTPLRFKLVESMGRSRGLRTLISSEYMIYWTWSILAESMWQGPPSIRTLIRKRDPEIAIAKTQKVTPLRTTNLRDASCSYGRDPFDSLPLTYTEETWKLFTFCRELDPQNSTTSD
jgi:hypothetical protein